MKKFVLWLLVALPVFLIGCGHGEEHAENALIVGMECNYAPYNWTQASNENGAIKIDGTSSYAGGYDVEISKVIAEKLGKKLLIKKISWDGLIPALNSGSIDIIVAGMSQTPEREKTVDFSEPYYTTSFVVLTKKNNPFSKAKTIKDFKDANFVGQKGTFYDTIIDQIKGVNHKDALNSIPLIINAISSGVADATVVENTVGDSIIKANPDMLVLRFPEKDGFQLTEDINNTVSVAIKKGNTDLTNAINTILANLSEDDRTALMNKAIETQIDGDN